jgi:hypothetical protein
MTEQAREYMGEINNSYGFMQDHDNGESRLSQLHSCLTGLAVANTKKEATTRLAEVQAWLKLATRETETKFKGY